MSDESKDTGAIGANMGGWTATTYIQHNFCAL